MRACHARHPHHQLPRPLLYRPSHPAPLSASGTDPVQATAGIGAGAGSGRASVGTRGAGAKPAAAGAVWLGGAGGIAGRLPVAPFGQARRIGPGDEARAAFPERGQRADCIVAAQIERGDGRSRGKAGRKGIGDRWRRDGRWRHLALRNDPPAAQQGKRQSRDRQPALRSGPHSRISLRRFRRPASRARRNSHRARRSTDRRSRSRR